MSDAIKYWIEISDYDLETAKALLKSKRYLYVGFMCHQTIEKIFKAYYVKVHNEVPPFTHSLVYLSEKAGIDKLFSDEQKMFIDELDPLNIEARYPSYKQEIFKLMTEEKSLNVLSNTEELQRWIKAKL